MPLQRPFRQFGTQPPRPFVGFVQVHVVELEADAQRADHLGLVVGQSVRHQRWGQQDLGLLWYLYRLCQHRQGLNRLFNAFLRLADRGVFGFLVCVGGRQQIGWCGLVRFERKDGHGVRYRVGCGGLYCLV